VRLRERVVNIANCIKKTPFRIATKSKNSNLF
jgi:hypothetical protein